MKENYTKIIELQNELSKKVITHDYLNNNNIRNVCGIDVCYKDLNAFCSAVIVNKNTLEIIEIVNETVISSYPYIPGCFMLREAETFTKNCKIIEKFI